MEAEDEEDIGVGEASEDEPDEIMEDFHLLEEDENSQTLEDELLQDSDEELEESSQLGYNTSPVTILSVPEVLHGRGRKKQKTSDKFVWYVSHPRASRTPQRNIVLHPPGNKGPAKLITNALDSWQLFFTNDILKNIMSNTNQENSEQSKKYKSHRPAQYEGDDFVPSSTRPSFVRDTSIKELKAPFRPVLFGCCDEDKPFNC